jgi:hypothetical protein
VVNAAFPVALAVAIGIPLVRARNVRNYFFVGLLMLIGGLTLVVHLALQGTVTHAQWAPRCESDAQRFARLQNFLLGLARPEGIPGHLQSTYTGTYTALTLQN